MAFFAIARVDDACELEVEKVDINLWNLPGVFGQQVLLCDIGVRVRLAAEATQSAPIKFDLAVPFLTFSASPEDLIPRMRDDVKLCELIFGDTGASPHIDHNTWVYDDGDGELVLQDLNRDQCTLRSATPPEQAFSVWRIAAGGAPIPADRCVYLRFRFRIRHAGQLWAWQGAGRRRSHSITDIRVNELRAQPHLQDAPDFSTRTKAVGRVNTFVIVPARYKAGRVSPEPKYVRILEGEVWAPYLGRKLSRRAEPFVITYWPKSGGVTPQNSFRGFLELERRRPTAGRAALLVAVFLAVYSAALQSKHQLSESILARSTIALWVLFAGSITVSGLLVAWRAIQPLLANGRWQRIGDIVRKWEARRYGL